MLRAFADRLEHPVGDLIADGAHLNVYYLQDNRPVAGQNPDDLLDAVEGAFGQKAREHFFALRNILPQLRGLEIIDNDNRGLQPTAAGGFERLPWKRYELENYVVNPDLLIEWARQERADFNNYSQANQSMQNTLWRAQTQTQKLSLFAEEFFRRIAEATSTRILLRKSDLYRLIERLDPASIDPEVAAKLDAILKLLKANRSL